MIEKISFVYVFLIVSLLSGHSTANSEEAAFWRKSGSRNLPLRNHESGMRHMLEFINWRSAWYWATVGETCSIYGASIRIFIRNSMFISIGMRIFISTSPSSRTLCPSCVWTHVPQDLSFEVDSHQEKWHLSHLQNGFNRESTSDRTTSNNWRREKVQKL